ncbi:DUF443 family protein [Virgibacillus sp. FSP13]
MHRRKKKLYDVVKLEIVPKNVIWIRPRSIKHFLKVSVAYIWLFGFNICVFLLYVQTRNFMVLIITSGLLFLFLLTSRIAVEEGQTTVRFKGYRKAV